MDDAGKPIIYGAHELAKSMFNPAGGITGLDLRKSWTNTADAGANNNLGAVKNLATDRSANAQGNAALLGESFFD